MLRFKLPFVYVTAQLFWWPQWLPRLERPRPETVSAIFRPPSYCFVLSLLAALPMSLGCGLLTTPLTLLGDWAGVVALVPALEGEARGEEEGRGEEGDAEGGREEEAEGEERELGERADLGRLPEASLTLKDFLSIREATAFGLPWKWESWYEPGPIVLCSAAARTLALL